MSAALPIPLIKCLYNKDSYCDPLRLSDECFNAFQERFGKESTYFDGKKFSIEPTFIEFVEEFGIHKSNGYSTDLACQLVPDELKQYIDVKFEKGSKRVCIDYATAFADILHENSSEYIHGCCDRLLLNRMYEKYNRITFIRNKYDALTTMTHTLDKAYHSEFFTYLQQYNNRVTT